jgi:hypothetical protein
MSKPDQVPLDVGGVPPNLAVTTIELPLADESLMRHANVTTPSTTVSHIASGRRVATVLE